MGESLGVRGVGIARDHGHHSPAFMECNGAQEGRERMGLLFQDEGVAADHPFGDRRELASARKGSHAHESQHCETSGMRGCAVMVRARPESKTLSIQRGEEQVIFLGIKEPFTDLLRGVQRCREKTLARARAIQV